MKKTEEKPLPEVEARAIAIVDNEDGSVTATLLVTQISVGRTLRVRDEDGGEDLFGNLNLSPAGDWPIRVRLSSREVAEGLEGVGEACKEVMNFISDIQNLKVMGKTDELRGLMPPSAIAAEWNR